MDPPKVFEEVGFNVPAQSKEAFLQSRLLQRSATGE
jgi:hypothetical protein